MCEIKYLQNYFIITQCTYNISIPDHLRIQSYNCKGNKFIITGTGCVRVLYRSRITCSHIHVHGTNQPTNQPASSSLSMYVYMCTWILQFTASVGVFAITQAFTAQFQPKWEILISQECRCELTPKPGVIKYSYVWLLQHSRFIYVYTLCMRVLYTYILIHIHIFIYVELLWMYVYVLSCILAELTMLCEPHKLWSGVQINFEPALFYLHQYGLFILPQDDLNMDDTVGNNTYACY